MKVGVLGAGGMGWTVVNQLKKSPAVSDIRIYDIVSERVTESRCRQHGVTGTARLNDILDDPSIPLVFITAANHAHKELAIRSMDAGKAVLCEKPMATSLEDARVMVETAERLGIFFQVGFELRYSHLYSKVKAWIDAGRLGTVLNTHCLYCSSAYEKGQWRNTWGEGGSTFSERLSHYVDLTRWWVGEQVTEVYSMSSPNVVPYT